MTEKNLANVSMREAMGLIHGPQRIEKVLRLIGEIQEHVEKLPDAQRPAAESAVSTLLGTLLRQAAREEQWELNEDLDRRVREEKAKEYK